MDDQQTEGEAIITPEMQREIFDMFDADGSGSIDCSELTDAMKLLGVKCSQVSARKVLAMIDTDNNGLVEWEEFTQFFAKVQTPKDMKMLLAETNQKFLEYKEMVDGDPSFGNRFLVPPSLPSSAHLEGHTDSVEAVAWISPTKILSASLDRDLRIWDLAAADGKTSSRVIGSASAGIYSLCAASDGSLAVTGLGGREENMCVWNLGSGDCVSKFSSHNMAVYCCDLTGSKRQCISGDQEGRLLMHDLQTEQLLCESTPHEGVINSCQYSEDEQLHCSSSLDGTVQVRCFRTPTKSKPVLIIEEAAASGAVFQACWQKEFRLLSCGDDYCIKLWDTRNIEHGPVVQFLGHTAPVRSIAVSSDKRFLASGTTLGAVRIWSIDELGDVDSELDAAGMRIEQLENRREKLEQKVDAEEAPVLANDLISMLEELKSLYEKAEFLGDVRDERHAMGCIQARLECGDHTLTVNGLGWTSGEDGTEQLVSASQDQTLLLSRFPPLNPVEFAAWGKSA